MSSINSDHQTAIIVDSARVQAYAAIESECDYQDWLRQKNGNDPSEVSPKTMEQFAYYMEDYLRELKTQLSRTWGPTAYDEARHTMRKITTLGVRAMQAHGAPFRAR